LSPAKNEPQIIFLTVKSNPVTTYKRPSAQQRSRLRAEMIMKVRCGLITAQQAADRLGVSRKTYYKWEQRGLSALLDGVADQRARAVLLRLQTTSVKPWRGS
jgi:DNA-binding transcriptional regulator YiaG